MRKKGRSLGFVLSFILLITAQWSIAYADTALPTKYDLREENRVTKVKNQGNINGCWAFTALSSLESNIKYRENRDMDFSENNMLTQHGFDLKSTDGGNMYMATAYLASWKGPVLEKKDTYPLSGKNAINRGIMNADYHVQDVIFIPKRENFKDNDKIKKAIKEYGAVYTNLKWDAAFYNREKKSYQNSSATGFDHAVAIVGWDDDYSKDHFVADKKYGDGAFICKNNWGSDWGEDGYFYVSYYDFNIAKTENAVFLGNNGNNYDNIYQYDELGQTAYYGFARDTAWFSNVFEAKNYKEKLKAVSFYTTKEDSTYEIWIAKDFNNIDSLKDKEKIKTGSISAIGYHTILLDDIELKANKKFAVIVKLTTKESKDPIAIESPKGKYASKAKANEKESFISSNGENWTDLTTQEVNSNVCLKAFTNSEKIVLKENDLKIEQIDQKDFSNGEEAFVKVKIKNEGSKEQKVALMVGLYDENNKMINHSYMNENIKPTEEMKVSASVFVPKSGKYKVKGFVWDDSDKGICYMKEPIELNIQ
ncbi:MAG: lectin like domain-containing protein [Marinisporobacter sp.]|jgi:C1A family cysteine protease|nr:lectin like domain-containing protein [Marinisporobacter sp.]